MNAVQLLLYYERVADDPNAVHHLRQFIIRLALQGKLIVGGGHGWRDEPIVTCLETLEDGKRIHQGWSPQCESAPSTFENDWGVLRTTAIQDGYFLQQENKRLPDTLAPKEHLEIQAGDILITCAGPRARCGVACLVTTTRKRLMISGKMYRFRANTALLLPGFLVLCLRGEDAQAAINGMKTGSSESGLNLTQERFSKLRLRFGTLVEQQQVIAKVDELTALCDRLEVARADREAKRDRLAAASLARLNAPAPETFHDDARFALEALPTLTTRPDQIKQLRQTILNLAVRGKLVPQQAKDGTGHELLSALKKSRSEWEANGRIRTGKGVPVLVLGEERYFEVPISWTWARLAEIGQTQTGTSPSSGNPDLFGNFIPFVKPSDLDRKEVNYDGPGLSEAGIAYSRLAGAYSVLMVCIGATLGKVNTTTRPVCFNQQINALTPFLPGLHGYVGLAMKASAFQSLSWGRAGIGTLPIISKGKWEILPIPLPPLPEQHRIGARVDELMALCDRLEASLASTDTQRRRLLEALLHEALQPSETTVEAAS